MKLMAKPTALIAGAAIAFWAAQPVWAQDSDAPADTSDTTVAETEGAEVPATVAVDANTVIATVNGEAITLGHVIVARTALPEQYQALPNEVLFQALIDQLIQQTVLGQAAAELPQRAEIQLENERRSLVAASEIEDVIAGAVSDEAIQAAYDADYAGAEPTQEWDASHILVESEEEAQALLETLDDGADFAELAQEKSIGPSGPNGGALGWFGPGMMVKEFEDAVTGMAVGDVAGPIKTQFGWHVVKLNDARMKGAPALDEVRADIVAKLENDAVEQALAALMDAAEVSRTDITGIDPNVIADLTILD